MPCDNIVILNRSGSSRSYFVSIKVPLVNDSDQANSFVYNASPKVSTGSRARFVVRHGHFAVCGSSSDHGLVKIHTIDSRPVDICDGGNLGSRLTVVALDEGAHFDDYREDCPTQGAFAIETGDFQRDDKSRRFIGLGAMDREGEIRPIATYPALPNTKTLIFPRRRYTVAWGVGRPGESVSSAQIDRTCELDFSSNAGKTATITHDENGNFVDITFD